MLIVMTGFIMPSYPRYLILNDGDKFHVTWQCHNNSWFLEEEWAKKLYYDFLLKWKDKYGVSIYSYNFMNSHPHLAGKTNRKEGISNLMRRINSKFAKGYNKRHSRKGQVIMDRFKSPVIQTDRHLLNVMAYFDLNPVRAKIVNHPKDYKWTSYHYYAYGKDDPLITPAPSFLALADTNEERRKIYIEMVEVLIYQGLEKKDYSRIIFIGNPDWVENNYSKLKIWSRNSYLEWKNRIPIDYECRNNELTQQ